MTGLSYGDLVAAATVGLSRRPLHITGLAGPAGAHASVLDSSDPAAAVLDAAALLTAARRAGSPPPPAPRGSVPGPAAADTAPELPARAAGVLEQLRASHPQLAADLLQTAARAGYRAPARLLPAWLDAAVRDPGFRPAVTALLGARGRWLAGHRADWQQVAGSGHTDLPAGPAAWRTGRRGERWAYLVMLRDRDPAAARDLLTAGWSSETGDDRAGLLAVLGRGLSGADEEFLEQALDDRKAAVRARAAALLGQLPGSAFTRRALQRAAPLLQVERHGMHRRLSVRLPAADTALDRAAARDGITPGSPAGIGASAWLLTQLIAAVPLAEWAPLLELEPGQLVSLPVAGNLGADLHAGWRIAVIRQASPQWAEALLEASPPSGASRRGAATWPPDSELAAVLPPAARCARASALLARSAPSAASPAAAAEVARCPGPWPDPLAGAVTAALSRTVAAADPYHALTDLAAVAARSMPATGRTDYATALAQLASVSTCPSAAAAALRRAAATIALRRAFLEEIM